jgi:hypothetical protein
VMTRAYRWAGNAAKRRAIGGDRHPGLARRRFEV